MSNDNEYPDLDNGNPPPWLHLLDPMARGWREKEILRGRDPDKHIETQLVIAGKWTREPKS